MTVDTTDELEDWRRQLDSIDRELIEVLANRMAVVKKIGAYKGQADLPTLDEARWREVLETRGRWGENRDLDREFVEKIYDVIHQYALQLEESAHT